MAIKPFLKVITKEEYSNYKEKIIREIAKGAVFIYPTQSMYCLGCDATNSKAVIRLRRIKQRFKGPFSVIVPNKAWIRKWCVVDKKVEKWVERLPGPYTLVLKGKPKAPVAPEVNPWKDGTIGVKLPRHWSSELATLLGRPIVSTTANQRGKALMTSLSNMSDPLRKNVDFVLYEGPKKGSPNEIIDLARRKRK